MNKIDFTKYPKVLTYVEGLLGKSFFRANASNPLDEETFIKVVEDWIDKYEADIDIMVKNTFLLYELTSGEAGYQALAQDWKRRKEVFKSVSPFSVAQIRDMWLKNFIACISHLYQASGNSNDCFQTIKGGATGCMISCSFRIEFLDSDLKSVKYNVVSDFRSTVIVDDDKLAGVYKELSADKQFSRVQFQDPEKYAGYSGIITNITTKNGVVGEVQFNTAKMIYAKEKPEDAKRIIGEAKWNEIHKATAPPDGGLGHSFYEKMRVFPKDSQEFSKIADESRTYYKPFATNNLSK